MRPYFQDYTATAAFVAVSSTALFFTGTIRSKTGNGSAIEVRGANHSTLSSVMAAGEECYVECLDLAKLEAKGLNLILQLRGTVEGNSYTAP